MLTAVDNARNCGYCSQVWKMLTTADNAHNCGYNAHRFGKCSQLCDNAHAQLWIMLTTVDIHN